jgi:putative DNA primase/helicase
MSTVRQVSDDKNDTGPRDSGDGEDWPEMVADLDAKRAAAPPTEKDIVYLEDQARPLRSSSYLTAVKLVRRNDCNILRDKSLELNEMTGRIEYGRRIITDEDISGIRERIESSFEEWVGKRREGIRLSDTDIHKACAQVAAESAYHPVREYLQTLKWDGVERLHCVADEILCVAKESLALASILVRKFFISAAARAMRPGCKVDTVMILVGPQGALKSTFFRTIGEPWFDDTAIDLSKKDAYESLRNAWILEWAELESLLRARDSNAVKAFLSSSKDTYRPSYGRSVIEVKRSGVIVGSTNHDEFLNDETGARRFWPVRTGAIRVDIAAEQRDQLWAEAMHLFSAGEPWWLTVAEEASLGDLHEQHRIRDAWEDAVLGWANNKTAAFTTADVLTEALEKPAGQWTRADEMRVAKILKSDGWDRKTDPANVRSKKWRKD